MKRSWMMQACVFIGLGFPGSLGWECNYPEAASRSVGIVVPVDCPKGISPTAPLLQVPVPPSRETPLIEAVLANDLEQAKKLLVDGADVGAKDEKGRTPLLLLLQIYSSDRFPMLRLLWKSGANIHLRGEYDLTGWNCVFWHAEAGFLTRSRVETVQALLDAGLNLKREGGELLISAAYYADIPVIQLLIKKGVDFHRYGPRALRTAAAWGQGVHYNPSPSTVRWLMSHGAYRPDDPDCRAAFINLAYGGEKEFTKQLLELGAGRHKSDLSRALIGASGADGVLDMNFGHPEVVRLLLQYGANPNARWGQSGPPLFHALLLGSDEGHEIARILLEHGANANTPALGGSTPLMVAARGDAGMVRLLLLYGADPNAKAADGRTPLMEAQTANSDPQSDIIDLLKQAGARR